MDSTKTSSLPSTLFVAPFVDPERGLEARMSSSTTSTNSKYLNSAGEIYGAAYDVALIVRDGPHRMLCTGGGLDALPTEGDYPKRNHVRKWADMDVEKETSEIE